VRSDRIKAVRDRRKNEKKERWIKVSDAVKQISGAEFEGVTGSGVVLVDFWAPWCRPCLMQIPILEQVAAQVGGRATIGKVNVEEEPMLASRYGIQSIPNLIIFKDGVPQRQYVGVQRAEQLISGIEGLLG
jgi:thioredoxin 1